MEKQMANNLAADPHSNKERVAIIMPVYNEAATIEGTIRELYAKVASKMANVDIWVFEDGSTDGTKEVLRKLAKEFPRLHVRMAAAKKGYPRAMREAFLSISPADYEFIVAIDSDGQYEPNDFFRLWRIMQRHAPDVVMGCRVVRREPLYRRFLSKGLQLLERMMFPLKCRDVTSVMRLMRVTLAQDVAKEIRYSPYNFWLEFTARMSLKHHSVIEVPITYRARAGNSKVYSLRRMPRVVLSEFRALRAVKKEYSDKKL